MKIYFDSTRQFNDFVDYTLGLMVILAFWYCVIDCLFPNTPL